MEWGNPRLCQRYREGFGRHEGSHKEPMNAVTDSRIGTELHRALRDAPAIRQAVNLPKLANFFFVLFLFGKEKGQLQTMSSMKALAA